MMLRIAMSLVLASGLCLAGCSKEDPLGFPKVDYNKDGKIIFEELIVVFPDLTVEEFLAADGDGTGTMSDQEYARFRQARESGRKPEAAPAPVAPAAKAAEPAKAPEPAPAPVAKPAEPAPAKAAEPAPAKPAEPASAPAAKPAEAVPAPAPKTAPSLPAAETVETVVAEPPAAPPAATAPAGGTTHVVGRGDTLTRIAKKYGVSVQAIMAANGMKDADRLEAGKTLTIPAAGSGSASGS
jgi:LysM repeat protein